MHKLRILALVFSFCLGLVTLGEAQTSLPRTSAPATWAVVKVDSSYQVILSSAVKNFKKELAKSDKMKLGEWNKARREARKKRRRFDAAKPKKTKFKLISSRFSSKSEANARKLALEEEDRKKRERSKRARSRPRSRPRGS